VGFTERSAPTRQSILAAARRLFAERGYESTTIRAVAAEVGVDASMVMRYYGSKSGLFSAAVDVDLYLEGVSDVPFSQLGMRIANHFLTRWEGELSDEVTTLLMRSATTNPEAAERMRGIFDTQITRLVESVVPDSTAPQRAALICSQLLGLAFTRYVIKLTPIATMEVEALVDLIAPTLHSYLTADIRTPGETSVPDDQCAPAVAALAESASLS
jgi:AcrR family transcriptional regulator